MKLNNKGSVTGLLVAGISVVALIATVVGIAQNNASRKASEAALNSTGVMLQENTLKVERLDDTHLEISGMICYSRHLQSGGKEDWTLWVTDNRGKPMDGDNDGSHIDGGRLSVAGNGSFPATCEYVDRAAGIGKMLDKNQKQPHRFSVIATSSRRLTPSYCPEIYLHYRGSWFSGTPFAKIALDKIEGACGPTSEPTPTDNPTSTVPTDEPEETPAPTDILATPTFTPTPTPDGTISGRISIYGCKKPNRASVDFCTGETCDELNGGKIISLPFTSGPSAQGVWLDDTNDDNTWIYNYRISVDKDNNPLEPSKTYFLSRALGWFDNDALFIDSEREQAEKLRVKPGTQRDFKVYASRTCGCAFDAVAYVKDTSGNIITELDNKPGIYGTANNKQFYDRGDKPVESVPFNNLGSNPGRIDVHITDLGDFRDSRTWGRDALAAVKLYADDYRVVKQECTSKNASTPSCPGYTTTWSETDMTKLRNPKIFENLRVACNTNLEYGWIIEKIPPTPTPQPPAAQPPVGGAPIGSIACALRDDNNANAAQNEGCKPRNFRIKEIKERTANLEWDIADNCPTFVRGTDRYWIIVKDKDTGEIVASRKGMKDEDAGVKTSDRNPGEPPHQVSVVRREYYDEGQEYTAYLYSYLDNNASCMSSPVSLNFTGVARDDSEEPEEPGDPGSGGGVCPQWCANESYCRSQGYVPKDPPAGEHCSVAGDKWCCPPGTEPPGGGGSGPGNPGQPGNPPGPGGQGVCPANSRGIPGFEGESFTKFSPESDREVCLSYYQGTQPVDASDGGFCCRTGSSSNPGRGGSGSNEYGTCDTAQNEYGIGGRPPAFKYANLAERQCRDMGGDCSAQKSRNGSGYCSKVAAPTSTAVCPSTHNKILVPPGVCAPDDIVRVRNLGKNEVCCKKQPSSPEIPSCASKGIPNPGPHERCTANAPALQGQIFKCKTDIGLTHACCDEYSKVNDKTSGNAKCIPSVSNGSYTIIFSVTKESDNGFNDRIDIVPKISWATGEPGSTTKNKFALTADRTYKAKFDGLYSKKYKIGCDMKLEKNGKTAKCQEIEIDIPRQSGGCRAYNITFKAGKITHGVGDFCGGEQSMPELDINQDGVINTIDLQYLYDEYGAEGATTSDVNKDGTVNALDLSVFMDSFGTEL